MGKKWDSSGVAFDINTWKQALRVAKPGALMLAFGGTRTFHRLACAIEDAGWELRDTLMWVYGSGFPKSHNGEWGGTALKPAWEPIILARKPLDGTVAQNFTRWGTGGMRIDECRVAAPGEVISNHGRTPTCNGWGSRMSGAQESAQTSGQLLGRWPANLAHDGSDEVIECFPDAKGQQGDLKPTGRTRPSSGCFGDMPPPHAHVARGDTGSASRFFYCAKASKKDKGPGNNHPTVKPTALMQWAARLVTPTGGHVLDPFTGSGSTGKACRLEGLQFTGVEEEAQWIPIANTRMLHVTRAEDLA